jgi:hypothetical protein
MKNPITMIFVGENSPVSQAFMNAIMATNNRMPAPALA